MGELIKKIRVDNIVLDVWENEAVKDGKTVMLESIKIIREYSDKSKIFHYVTHFRVRDIDNIEEVINQYREWKGISNK